MKHYLHSLLFVFMATVSLAQDRAERIYRAVANEHISALDKLVDSTNVNECLDFKGGSYVPLVFAFKKDAMESLDHLLKIPSIDINKSCTGKTPVLYAAKYGKLDILKKLIAHGADIRITNKGRSAIDYAKRYKHRDVYEYLKEQLK